MSKLDPLAVREFFPALERTIYLQHGGHAIMSTRTQAELERVAKIVGTSVEWDGYQSEWEALRSRLATLVGATADEVTLVRGTGHGISLVARGIDWREGDNVVSVRGEFPTNVFPWTLLRQRGVDFRRADLTEDGRIDIDALFALVDDHTRAVSLSWIAWWNGYRADIAEIGKRCRERGVIFALDAIQGVGAVNIDVVETKVDVLACGASKWLMGPPGAGFAYVRREVQDELFPPLLGGGNVQIAPGQPYEDLDELKTDARRYEESAISWFDIAALGAGLSLIEDVGMDVVEDRVLGLAAYIGDALVDRGYQMVEPWPRTREESSGMVSVRPKTPAADAVQILADEGIVARLYRDWMRFSTHFFNTHEELDRVIQVMEDKVEA